MTKNKRFICDECGDKFKKRPFEGSCPNCFEGIVKLDPDNPKNQYKGLIEMKSAVLASSEKQAKRKIIESIDLNSNDILITNNGETE